MTVYGNMAFSLKMRKMKKKDIDTAVREAAKILDLEELLSRKPKALSGGQKQRVAMGRAIVRNPKVFLMDEPLSNLDAKLRVQMRTEIAKLHQRLGATIIYVTHDQTEAMTLGTRIVVMKDGIVQQIDSPQNLYNRPVNQFVAGFIGSPQMNFLNTVCERRGNVAVLLSAGNEFALSEGKSEKLLKGGYEGKGVVMGIRPEDITEGRDCAKSGSGAIPAAVDVYELLGAEVFLYFEVNQTQIVARVSPNTKLRRETGPCFKWT